MRVRRLLCVVLGMWLGGCLFMTLVATRNFRSVDRLLADPAPEAAERIKQLGGAANARPLLRYAASEQNRWFFDTWEWIQLALATAVFLTLLFGSDEGKVSLGLALAAGALLLAQHFFLTPEITVLGRTLDFLHPDLGEAERRRFWFLHSAYSAAELAKWGVIVGLCAKFIFARRRRSRNAGQQIDVIDKADYRHVDR